MIKTYSQFINERYETSDKPQIQIIKSSNPGLNGKPDMFNKKAMNILFDKYVHLVCFQGKEYDPEKYRTDGFEKNRKGKLKTNEPMLCFGNIVNSRLKDPSLKIFNKPEHCKISVSKVDFTKKFSKEPFIPKTVYSLDDIKELALPIIAKPDDGMRGEGIEKFDTYDDVINSKLKFSLWQECKDIKREFRFFVMNNKIIHIVERIQNQKNDTSVGNKKPDEKLEHILITQKLDNFPYINSFKNILDRLSPKLSLDFYCIDIMVDVDDIIWCPEINTGPGVSPDVFYPIYKEWMQLAYNKEIDKESDDELSKIANDHIINMKNKYTKEYKHSLNPV